MTSSIAPSARGNPADPPHAAMTGAEPSGNDILQLHGVNRTFTSASTSYQALDDIDLYVAKGEFLCLLGPSGCGKSTLLNIIAGFLPATSGSVRFAGREITGPDPRRMMVFQDSSQALFPWLTAEGNVSFGLKLRGVSPRERKATAARHLASVGLVDRSDRFPHEMSGGMRQRLQIARSLATDPEMLLMDEPFGALDAITRRHMHQILLKIWDGTGMTVIFVTHDISESLLLGDRIAVMSVGPSSRIRELIDIRALERPRDPASAKFGAVYRRIEQLLDNDPNITHTY